MVQSQGRAGGGGNGIALEILTSILQIRQVMSRGHRLLESHSDCIYEDEDEESSLGLYFSGSVPWCGWLTRLSLSKMNECRNLNRNRHSHREEIWGDALAIIGALTRR